MANYENQPRYGGTLARGAAGVIDEGLRAHMIRVYNYMAIGLVLTGAVAFAVVNTPLGALFFQAAARGYTLLPLGWIAFIAPLGLVMWMSFGIHRMSVGTAQLVFWGYAALMGVALAPVLLIYTGASVAKVFFISAAAFGG
jgi:FtsH-binding integral membrane protein